jgi:hypothetical protein
MTEAKMSDQNKDLNPAVEQAILQIQMELFYHQRRIQELRNQLQEISTQIGIATFQIKVLPVTLPDEKRTAKVVSLEAIKEKPND